MGYRNTVETQVGAFVVGQYVIFPTTSNGSWSGIFAGFGEPLGQYASAGAVDVKVQDESTGQVHTLRSSRYYSGYMTPVSDPDPEPEEPKRYLFEVQVPVKGEVLFCVVATTEEEARDIISDWGWDDGELNVEPDDDATTHVVRLGEE